MICSRRRTSCGAGVALVALALPCLGSRRADPAPRRSTSSSAAACGSRSATPSTTSSRSIGRSSTDNRQRPDRKRAACCRDRSLSPRRRGTSAHPTSQACIAMRGLGGNAASCGLILLDGVPVRRPLRQPGRISGARSVAAGAGAGDPRRRQRYLRAGRTRRHDRAGERDARPARAGLGQPHSSGSRRQRSRSRRWSCRAEHRRQTFGDARRLLPAERRLHPNPQARPRACRQSGSPISSGASPDERSRRSARRPRRR